MRALFTGIFIVGFVGMACAQTAPDHASATAALAKAEAAAKQADALGDQWTVTVKALKAAHDAADIADYATETAQAAKALNFAKLSIAQVQEQKVLWHNEAIK